MFMYVDMWACVHLYEDDGFTIFHVYEFVRIYQIKAGNLWLFAIVNIAYLPLFLYRQELSHSLMTHNNLFP